MVGIRLLLLALLICIGLGPATAQDVYINRYQDRDDGQRPTVYINRNRLEKNERNNRRQDRSGSFQRSNSTLIRDAKTLKDRIEVFNAWERSGRSPKTVEEVLSYADSKRAVTEAGLLKRRKKLIANAYQRERAERNRLAREERGTTIDKPNYSRSSRSVTQSNTVTRTIIKKDRIFVDPNNKDGSKPGVFTDYR